MLRLDFSVADLNLAENRDKTRRSSVSGVQDKVQLRRVRGGFEVVESGGDYILKPVPRNTSAELAADLPANEAFTMDVAGRLFGIRTAEHALVEMKDGEDEVRDGLAGYAARQEAVERLLAASRLSPEAKARYLAKFRDRLRAIAQ